MSDVVELMGIELPVALALAWLAWDGFRLGLQWQGLIASFALALNIVCMLAAALP